MKESTQTGVTMWILCAGMVSIAMATIVTRSGRACDLSVAVKGLYLAIPAALPIFVPSELECDYDGTQEGAQSRE